mgnify:CR=1 FL=1
MPVATPEQYAEMLDTAKAKGFAFPAINVSSSSTINSVLQGLTEAGSDGIIQVTTGGADYFAGQSVKARASGALAFAAFATEVAKNYPITVALHTDHCPKDALGGFVEPLTAFARAMHDEIVIFRHMKNDRIVANPAILVEGRPVSRFADGNGGHVAIPVEGAAESGLTERGHVVGVVLLGERRRELGRWLPLKH